MEIVKGLRAEAFYSLQTNSNVINEYRDQNDYWGGLNRDGLASNQEDASNTKLFETTLHYNGNLISDLNLNFVGGYSYQDFNNEGFYTQGGGLLRR